MICLRHLALSCLSILNVYMLLVLLQILTGRFSGVVTAAAKTKGWDDLAKEVSAVSGVSRTGQEILKKWTCLKSETKKMATAVKKSVKAIGGGPEFIGDVSFVDGRILDVIGSVAVRGVSGGFDSALADTGMYQFSPG